MFVVEESDIFWLPYFWEVKLEPSVIPVFYSHQIKQGLFSRDWNELSDIYPKVFSLKELLFSLSYTSTL